jgi:PAT family beta-lactamase induction signal transducer AmpG
VSSPSGDRAASGSIAAPLWGVLVLPFGLAVGFAQIAVPYQLRARGADMTTIGFISFVTGVPHFLKFFWSPAIDAGWPRRRWLLASIALTAGSLGLAALVPPSVEAHLGPFTLLAVYTALLTIAQAGAATSSSAVLALMAQTLTPDAKGKASGWQTAGSLAGTSIGGALLTWCLTHLAPPVTALVIVSLCAVSALPVLSLHEPTPAKHPLGQLLLDLLRDVWASVRAREGWTALVICLAPVGTGALLNLVSGLAHDYAGDDATREQLAEVVSGVLGGIVQAAGALVGGYVCDRMNRRLAYALFGGLTGAAAVGMMIGPATPVAFTVGCLAYSFATGLCYAAFYAFILETVSGGAGLATKVSLFVSASNVPLAYVSWLDGAAYDWAVAWSHDPARGRFGMCSMDAVASFVGIGILLAMLLVVRRLGAGEKQPTPSLAP